MGILDHCKDAMTSIILGMVLVVASFVVLGWNEGRAVRTARDIDEGQDSVTSVSCDFNSANEGALLHITCPISEIGTVTDPTFGVAANTLFLYRIGEKYQVDQTCRTEKDQQGNTRETCSEQFRFSPNLISCCKNSPQANGVFNDAYKSAVYPDQEAEYTALVGPFRLNNAVAERLREDSTKTRVTALPPTQAAGFAVVGQEYHNYQQLQNPPAEQYKVYFEEDSLEDGAMVSVVFVQSGDSFAPFIGEHGTRFLLVAIGSRTAEELFQDEVDKNTTTTWLLRFIGFAMMWAGFSFFFGAWTHVVEYIPWIGDDLADFFQGVVCCVTFPLALCLSLLVIAIAWLAYRPAIGIPLLIVSVLIGVGIWYFLRRRKQNPPPPPAGPHKPAFPGQRPPYAYNPSVGQPPAAMPVGVPVAQPTGGPEMAEFPPQQQGNPYPPQGQAPPQQPPQGGNYPGPQYPQQYPPTAQYPQQGGPQQYAPQYPVGYGQGAPMAYPSTDA